MDDGFPKLGALLALYVLAGWAVDPDDESPRTVRSPFPIA